MTVEHFKPIPMPKWWDERGRCYLSGTTVVIVHPSREPHYWQNGEGEWVPWIFGVMKNVNVLEVDPEKLKIWWDEADQNDDG